MQTCKYSQPGLRAAFVAAGLALLACLLAVGIQPLAAGPGALPQKTDVAALTCRDLDADGRPPLPLLWLDGYVSAQMNLHSVPVVLWRTKYFVAELPLILSAQCRRTLDMTITEAWKTVKMYEKQDDKVYLDAPCSDLLRLNKKHGVDFTNLALWWDGWRGWQERGRYQEQQEGATERGGALEAACKATPRKPLMKILTELRGDAARPDAE